MNVGSGRDGVVEVTKAVFGRVTSRVVGRGDNLVEAEENTQLRDDRTSEVWSMVREQTPHRTKTRIHPLRSAVAVSRAVVDTSGNNNVKRLNKQVTTSTCWKPLESGHGPATSAATTSLLNDAGNCCKGT